MGNLERFALVARGAFLVGMAFIAVLSSEACDCDEILTNIDAGPGPLCDLSLECEDNSVERFGECVRSGCESDADCCPGTRCRTDFNTCWPYQLDNDYACEVDSDCADPAQRCLTLTLGERDPIAACAFERCESDNDCGAERTCFHSVCVKNAPCGGSCGEGEVCDVLTGTCSAVPEGAEGCDLPCDGLRVLADPDGMSGDICCASLCECAALPPLVPGRYGRESGIAHAGDKLLVSAYDAEYGDLVVVTFGLDGTEQGVTYVDGAPAGVPPVAAPSGPRGGVVEPGPDVGTHTSIVANSDGEGRVAYHDVDGRALKVAVQTGSAWTSHVVDSGGEDSVVGQFTDIVIDDSGRLVVSYLARNVTGAPGFAGPVTALKIARSTTPAPSSSAEWDTFFVDHRPVLDPCEGACTANQACVAEGGVGVCKDTAASCPSACGSEDACVVLDEPDDEGNTSACAPPPLPEADEQFPRARGLHTSVVANGADTAVAYYDSIDGDLRLATVASNGTATTQVVDGDGVDGRRLSDSGRFPALAKVGDTLWLAYTDFGRHRVRLWKGNPGEAGEYSVLDPGTADNRSGLHFVGAGTQVAPTGTGAVAVYQDATSMDLVLARPDGEGWARDVLRSDGAEGFFSDVVVEGGTAYVSAVKAELNARGEEQSRVTVSAHPLP